MLVPTPFTGAAMPLTDAACRSAKPSLKIQKLPDGGGLVTLRIEVTAQRADSTHAAVLDWRLVGAMA